MLLGRLAAVALTDGCRFIDGDPRQSGWSYCGKEPAEKGASWCVEHYDAVHVKTRKTRSDRARSRAASRARDPNAIP